MKKKKKWPRYLSTLPVTFCISTITLIIVTTTMAAITGMTVTVNDGYSTPHVTSTVLNIWHIFLRVQKHRHCKVLLIESKLSQPFWKSIWEHVSKDLNICMYFDPWKKKICVQEIWGIYNSMNFNTYGNSCNYQYSKYTSKKSFVLFFYSYHPPTPTPISGNRRFVLQSL